jgi:hypothetical protein
MNSIDTKIDSKVNGEVITTNLDTKNFENVSTGNDLKDNKIFEINLGDDCGGEPEPGCFSSLAEFRYRVWEFCSRWKYIICC